MTTCTNCNGTKVEPNADGLSCHACVAVPSWVQRHGGTATTQNNLAPVADAAGAVADGVSDYFLISAIGDAVSAVGSGIGTVAECTGDAVGAVGECVGEIIGAVLS
jgi:hypothetical protein